MELYIQKTAGDPVEVIDGIFQADGKTAFDILRHHAANNIIAGMNCGNRIFELSISGTTYFIRYHDGKRDQFFETKNSAKVVELITRFIRKQKIKRPMFISFMRILSSLIPCAGIPILFATPLENNHAVRQLFMQISFYMIWGGGIFWMIVHGELPVNLVNITRKNNPVMYYAFLAFSVIILIQFIISFPRR